MRHDFARRLSPIRGALPGLFATLSALALPVAAADAPALFQQHCAVCHGPGRLGLIGPALLPESLSRLRKPEAIKTIGAGRAATQMLGFADRLDKDEIAALADYIYTAVSPAPTLTEGDIRASRIVSFATGSLPTKPAAVFQGVDMMNLFIVVETGDHHVTLLDGDLNLLKVHEVWDKERKESSRVSAVYDAAPRQSFVAALKDVPEVWEISYNPKADEIAVGMVHDFKYQEGAFIPGFLNPRRSFLTEPLDDFFFTQNYSELMGSSREAGKGQVVHLDVRKKIADLKLPGMPHLGSGITWNYRPPQGTQDRRVMATPNLKEGLITVIDMQDWSTLKTIPTLGPGFFMRSHENTPYAWTDSMMSKGKDTLQVIDKRTLEKVAEVRTDPGKTLAHVEFTRDGKYVLASLWERKADGGALIVFDAATFKEVKRIPMDKPVGKYNLWNKINRSEGTSH
jgi:mono/diheme cytochrome c family protein